MGEESKNCTSFRMCLNLNDYQFKTSRYSYRSTYVNSMVTANQKPTIDTQKTREKGTQANHQTKREETKRRRKEQRTTRKQKTSNKMT